MIDIDHFNYWVQEAEDTYDSVIIARTLGHSTAESIEAMMWRQIFCVVSGMESL